jgi:prophage maintenance system killer protein
VMFTFLKVNSWHLVVPEPEAVMVMQDVAAGTMNEKLLAKWLQRNSQKST